jgi:3-hydroxyisobutyrate dehydrogenase-like beta-hydroxyacid dehydrogenase
LRRLAGPHAEAFVAAAEGLGMNLKVFSAEIGGASSVKMCRSIMIKGLEALTTECMLTARHYGVEEHVLASLGDTLPHPDWRGLARYVMSRALIHGKRRSEEVMEVAVTVDEAGVPPMMSRAIAERQALAAEQGRMLPKEVLASGSLDELLDTLLAQRALSHRTAAD